MGDHDSVDPAGLALTLILNRCHSVKHFVCEVLRLFLGTAAEQNHDAYHQEFTHILVSFCGKDSVSFCNGQEIMCFFAKIVTFY
jgi:hypothetical protein